MDKTREFSKDQFNKDLPDIKIGQTIKVLYKFKEKGKERKQSFSGVLISLKGSGVSTTMTIRSLSSGVKMERIIPIHSPNIEKIEILKEGKVRRAKLYYLRTAIGKKSRLKTKESVKTSEKKTPAEKSENIVDKETEEEKDN